MERKGIGSRLFGAFNRKASRHTHCRSVCSLRGGLVPLLMAWGSILSYALPAGAATSDLFLEANGVNLRNAHGTGDIVSLRGFSLGGWLIMEAWMTPMNSTTNLPDNYSALQTLDSRFGVVTQQLLISTYQQAWIETNDLDNIKAMGMNVVRVPVWWADFEALDGTWRTDAFDRLDWLVTNAWQRGIYTIIDMHGVPGGQSTDQSTGQINQNQYWSNTNDQNSTTIIWQTIAAHYNNNPAVAGYDLINEPQGAPDSNSVWSAYDGLYQAIRAVDPDHIIFMEGTWGNWDWSMLPDPAMFGWQNVAYEMHEYQWTSSTNATAIMAGVDNQVSDFKNHQSWNVPAFIGEFNEFSAGSDPTIPWKYAVQQFNSNNMNWTVWTYKTISGGVPNDWGLYNPTGVWPPTPNLKTKSSSTISNDWALWNTTTAFGINPILQQTLGAPVAVPDSYTATAGVTLVVGASAGVLANDTDINLGQSGIQLSAAWFDGPANGQLTLNADGSFSYISSPGFVGADAFRYTVFDGYVGSVNIATVTIQVGPPTYPAGWADADIGSPGEFGSTQYNSSSGIWTVSGGGSDIWGTNDQFNFISTSVTNDGSIIAQVTSLQDTDPWAKAGVMFRNDNTPGSLFADVVITPGNGVSFQWRDVTSGSCTSVQVSAATPVWVKLSRSGNSFSGYYSTDGANWIQIGTSQTIAMNSVALVGLAVTAHNNGLLTTATFAAVNVDPPLTFPQWQMKYFSCTNCPAADAAADPDGDGQSNLAEFLAGTDPTSSASYFHIINILSTGIDVQVTWMTGAGKTNALQRATGAADGSYSNNFADIFTVTNTVGAVTNYVDAGAATNTLPQYYRIRLVP